MEFIILLALLAAVIFVLALLVKPIRKTIGLCMVIFGVLGILTFWLAIPGAVSVIVGSILLFI